MFLRFLKLFLGLSVILGISKHRNKQQTTVSDNNTLTTPNKSSDSSSSVSFVPSEEPPVDINNQFEFDTHSNDSTLASPG